MTDLNARISECRERWGAAPLTRAFIPLADLLRRAGRNDEALAVLDEGLRHHPQAVGGLVTLARTLASAGRPTQAAEAAVRVLEFDPDNLVALELIADENRRRGDLVAASGHYERLAELDTDNDHWAAVLTSLREQRAAAAVDASGSDGAEGFATLTLVDLYLAQGYRQKAESLLRRLADERPDDLQVGRRLAELPGAKLAEEDAGASGPSPGGDPLPNAGTSTGRDDAGDRREQARMQFASWIERLRIEREVSP
jgi:tetratricopeptide (TPR) repeat protein